MKKRLLRHEMMEDRKRVGEEDQNALEAIYEGFDFAKK